MHDIYAYTSDPIRDARTVAFCALAELSRPRRGAFLSGRPTIKRLSPRARLIRKRANTQLSRSKGLNYGKKSNNARDVVAITPTYLALGRRRTTRRPREDAAKTA